MTEGQEEIEFLLGSENRTAVLEALKTAGRLDRYALEERLGSSRRTVTRTVNALEERNYIDEGENGYSLTAFGARLLETYREFTDDVSLARKYRPFLGHLEPSAIDFELSALRGAKLIVAEKASPYAALDRTLDLRRNASRVREMAPSVEKRSIEQLVERIENDEEVSFEVILTDEVARAAESKPEYRSAHETIQQADNVSQYVYPGDFPFFIGVMDDTVAVGSIVDGSPYAVVVSENESLREWGERKLDEFERKSTPIQEVIAD